MKEEVAHRVRPYRGRKARVSSRGIIVEAKSDRVGMSGAPGVVGFSADAREQLDRELVSSSNRGG